MKPGNAIEVNNIKKRFKVYYDKGNSLKEKMLFWNRNRYENHWVLKGVSFEIKKGEVVGLIGKNGSGKSTTLKMLTKIMYPTEGSIEMTGRVSSLLELGAGFHPDMSGKENIFTNASIFGLTHAEIESRLDDIIRYSELEEFIDNPVRTYSSGMYMRLAFAVAINVDADILLIDEVLAVGDVSFQVKCFEKLQEIKRKGATIVIVSHTMSQIERICDRAIWIEDGVIREDGSPKIVGGHYTDMMEEKRVAKIEKDFQDELARKEVAKKAEEQQIKAEESKKKEEEKRKKEEEKKKLEAEKLLPAFCRKGASRRGNQKIYFTDARIVNSEGKETQLFKIGEKFEIQIKYKADIVEELVNVSINISRIDGVFCYGTTLLSGLPDQYKTQISHVGENGATLVFEANNLLEGVYLVDLTIQNFSEKPFDQLSGALEFRVLRNDTTQVGLVNMPRYWISNDEKIIPGQFRGKIND